MKPHHVFEDIRRRRAGSGEPDDPIRFYWVTITHEDDGGDRNRFRRLLRESAGGYPLLPAVLRVAGFEDPNAVMNDLAAVLETCRNDLQAPEVRERSVRHGFVDFVLISRREFALAATSSPLHLPDWFPVSSGQDVTARIEDLTWSAGVALSAPEAHIGEIKRLLCELDGIAAEGAGSGGGRSPAGEGHPRQIPAGSCGICFSGGFPFGGAGGPGQREESEGLQAEFKEWCGRRPSVEPDRSNPS